MYVRFYCYCLQFNGTKFCKKVFKIVHLFPLKKFRLSEEKEEQGKTIKRKILFLTQLT